MATLPTEVVTSKLEALRRCSGMTTMSWFYNDATQDWDAYIICIGRTFVPPIKRIIEHDTYETIPCISTVTNGNFADVVDIIMSTPLEHRSGGNSPFPCNGRYMLAVKHDNPGHPTRLMMCVDPADLNSYWYITP